MSLVRENMVRCLLVMAAGFAFTACGSDLQNTNDYTDADLQTLFAIADGECGIKSETYEYDNAGGGGTGLGREGARGIAQKDAKADAEAASRREADDNDGNKDLKCPDNCVQQGSKKVATKSNGCSVTEEGIDKGSGGSLGWYAACTDEHDVQNPTDTVGCSQPLHDKFPAWCLIVCDLTVTVTITCVDKETAECTGGSGYGSSCTNGSLTLLE